jgi:PHD/YefM family antitoxin component YafN of YafNO toxin-antitoxin module
MGEPKIKSATKLREDIYETLKEVSEGITHVITHKKGEPVYLLSKENYEDLAYERHTLRKIHHGLVSHMEGRTLSHKDAKSKLKELKKSWQ